MGLRQGTGLSQRAFAERYGIKPGTYAHWESGSRTPDPDSLMGLLDKMGVTEDQRDNVLVWSQGVDEPRWHAVTLPEQRAAMAATLDIEKVATEATDVSPSVIPGLLQTREYMDQIMSDGDVPFGERSTRTTVRIGRRDVITRNNAAKYFVYLGEAALHQIIGSPQLMIKQLRYVLELSQLPNITIHVVPFTSGWHPGLEGAFYLIRADEGPVVHIELRDTALFLHQPVDIARYEDAVTRVAAVAMKPDESLSLIAKIADQMEQTA